MNRQSGETQRQDPARPAPAPPPAAAPSAMPLPPGRIPPHVVLACHIVFTIINTSLFANIIWLMPMLVRLRFGAEQPDLRDWQTSLITAAIPAFMISSIFWHELLRRTTLRTYLLIYWLVSAIPLAAIALVQNYPQLLACHIVGSIGVASWPPANGRLLQHLYPEATRGRAFAVLNIVGLIGSIATVYLLGTLLGDEPNAFRIFLPAAAAAQLAGVVLLIWLARRTAAPEYAETPGRWSWAALLWPVRHMGEILRQDPVFRRYEQAFMTYGAAYMLCEALLPVLATARLGMRYEEYAHTTQVMYRLGTLATTLPMGWLLDRLGAIRTSGISFGILAFYPLMLLFAWDGLTLAVASGIFGVGLAGVMMGWMLGPVSLAGSPQKVPHYVAIHATLVGIRGILFQGLGMLLYQITGSFSGPLVLAVVCFAWAAWQMWRLQATVGGGR